MKVICLLVGLLFFYHAGTAQGNFRFSMNAGLALPVGQLASTNVIGGGLGIMVGKPVSRHWSALGEAAVMSMVGSDKNGFKYDSRQLFGFTAGARYYINPLQAKVIWYSQLKGGVHLDKGYAGPAVEGGWGCLLYPNTTRLDMSVRYQENFQEHEVYHTRFFSVRVGYVLQFTAKRKRKK